MLSHEKHEIYVSHAVSLQPVVEFPQSMPGRKTAPCKPLRNALCTKRSAANLLRTYPLDIACPEESMAAAQNKV